MEKDAHIRRPPGHGIVDGADIPIDQRLGILPILGCHLPVGAVAGGAVVQIGLPVDADNADTVDPAAPTCGDASDGEPASERPSDDEALTDYELVGVKVLPVLPCRRRRRPWLFSASSRCLRH